MLNIAFCDDSRSFLKKVLPIILAELRKYGSDLNVEQYYNGDGLILEFKKNPSHFDIIFLDIDMPGVSGKEVAQVLRSIDKNFKLIFMTAYENEVLNMFQYDIIGFLPKDKLKKYLPDTIKRVMSKIENENPMKQLFQSYSLKGDRKIIELKLALNDIIYFEVLNRQVFVHTIYGIYQLYHYKFGNIMKKYVQLGFLDIHRTCIVNVKYVISVEDTQVQLDNGEKLVMSRRKRKQVMEVFMDDIYEEGGPIS